MPDITSKDLYNVDTISNFETAGKACKGRGTTITKVSEAVKVSPQTLDNWFKKKPYVFDAVVYYTTSITSDNYRGENVTKYFKVTEKELIALQDFSDSMLGMTESGNSDFDQEAQRGAKAIDAILKRAGLQRNSELYSDSAVKI